MASAGRPLQDKPWTFLTNHARVLIEITRNRQSRLRDLAATIGITERAAQAIVNDLEAGGYITRTRVGRRTNYSVDPDLPFRHPADADHLVKGLLLFFTEHEADHAETATQPVTGESAER